jgi:hypothetical protein
MAGAGLFALVEIALFLWPGATRGMRMTVGGILIEFAGSAAILGATGKCPACGAGFGMEHKSLIPPRCRRCGVALLRPHAAEGERTEVDIARLIEEERDRWPI